MQTFKANLKRSILNREPADIGGGRFSPDELRELLNRIEDLEAALYMALPYVEDHEDSPAYKAGTVAAAVAIIKKVLRVPTP